MKFPKACAGIKVVRRFKLALVLIKQNGLSDGCQGLFFSCSNLFMADMMAEHGKVEFLLLYHIN